MLSLKYDQRRIRLKEKLLHLSELLAEIVISKIPWLDWASALIGCVSYKTSQVRVPTVCPRLFIRTHPVHYFCEQVFTCGDQQNKEKRGNSPFVNKKKKDLWFLKYLFLTLSIWAQEPQCQITSWKRLQTLTMDERWLDKHDDVSALEWWRQHRWWCHNGWPECSSLDANVLQSALCPTKSPPITRPTIFVSKPFLVRLYTPLWRRHQLKCRIF